MGHPVAVKSFQQIDYQEEFDGVWASASLLHCPRTEIHDVMTRIAKALKPDGLAYLSFKWGEGDTVDDLGRRFTNYTTRTLRGVIDEVALFAVIDLWSESSVLRGSEQKWANAVLRRVP